MSSHTQDFGSARQEEATEGAMCLPGPIPHCVCLCVYTLMAHTIVHSLPPPPHCTVMHSTQHRAQNTPPLSAVAVDPHARPGRCCHSALLRGHHGV